jgi:hypothetical protein
MAGDLDDAALSEAALSDWNREEEDAAWAHLQEPGDALTPMLERAIQAARALPQADQDALAAEILGWIEDERRWAESFARTHEALAELAREALSEHHADHTLDVAESSDALPAADLDERRRASEE